MQEIRLRYDMLKLVKSSIDITPQANQRVAEEIMSKSKDDPYFADSCSVLLPENVHTLGYMKACRNSFEHVGESVAAVLPSISCGPAPVRFGCFKFQSCRDVMC